MAITVALSGAALAVPPLPSGVATVEICWDKNLSYSQWLADPPLELTRFQLEVARAPGGALIADQDLGDATRVGISINEAGYFYVRLLAFYESEGSGGPVEEQYSYGVLTVADWHRVYIPTVDPTKWSTRKTNLYLIGPADEYYAGEWVTDPSPSNATAQGIPHTMDFWTFNPFMEQLSISAYTGFSEFIQGGAWYHITEPWLESRIPNTRLKIPETAGFTTNFMAAVVPRFPEFTVQTSIAVP